MADYQVNTYLDDGRVLFYTCGPDYTKALEHASAIVARGYRHYTANEVEVYPPHRIVKVKVTGGPVPTDYPDSVKLT